MSDVFPLSPAGFIEVDVRVDPARKDVQTGRIDLFAVFVEVQSDCRDQVGGCRDVGFVDPPRSHDRAAANDHCFARSSRKRLSTSRATATSSVVTDSAGLWLTPPLHRT